jgi:hypothetical protein
MNEYGETLIDSLSNNWYNISNVLHITLDAKVHINI